MKLFAIGSILITFPAIIVALYAIASGRPMMLAAALVSLTLNTLPFIAAMLLLRNNADAADVGH